MDLADFGALNWAIVIGYLIMNLALGGWMSRKVKSASDYHLGDKSTPWWAIGISIVASYVSALSFLGAPAWAYGAGMAALIIHINYPLVVFITIVFFVPFFYTSGVASIYEYLERRFGVRARAVIGLVFLITMTMSAGSMITATGIVAHSTLGIDIRVAIVAMTTIVVIYTMLGGMNAVIWTDVLQGLILTIGVAVVLACIFRTVPFDGAMTFLAQHGKLNPINAHLDFSVPPTIWAGVFAMTLYHITVYAADQYMIQRALAAKSMADAKKAYMVIGFAAFVLYFLFFFVGAMLYVFYRGKPFEQPNEIILLFVRSLAIPGLMGILVAAVLSAAMSASSAALNSLATISVTDFYEKFFVTHGSDRHYLLVSRALTIGWGLVLVPVAIAFASSKGSLLETISAVGSYLVGAKLALFGMGFFSKHASERGLLIGVIVSLVALAFAGPVGALVPPVDQAWAAIGLVRPHIAWPWFAVIGGVVNAGVGWIASVALDGFQTDWHEYSVRGQILKYQRENLPMTQNGWFVVPGKIDRWVWLLPAYFLGTIGFLVWFGKLG